MMDQNHSSIVNLVNMCFHSGNTEIDFETLLETEELLILKWKKKGKDFWFKFVVTLRDVIMQQANFQYNPKESDGVFVSLLQKLTMISFKGMSELLNNLKYLKGCKPFLPDLNSFSECGQIVEERKKVKLAAKAVFTVMKDGNLSRNQACQCYTLHLVCVGTFINVVKQLEIESSEILTWIVPISWYYPASHIYPFEAFIKEKWGDTIASVCNIKKNQIGWWDSIKKLVKLPLNDENSANFSPNLGWLPKRRAKEFNPALPKYRENFDLHHGQFTWNLILLSFPPLMARKFHTAKADAFDAYNARNIAIGPWFVIAQEALGAPFLDLINHMHSKLMALAHQSYQLRNLEHQLDMKLDGMKEWLLKIDQMQSVAAVIRDHDASPRQPGDGVECSAEFLLEPCVLIQLPWNPVVQRQWLAAAFLEILKFEFETVELRHWAVPIEVDECARELLTLIRQAKECLLLGIYWFSKHTIAYPNTFGEMPAIMMDKVVIPVTVVLELLCSGQAYRILHAIRSASFSTPHSLDSCNVHKLKWMPEAAYLPPENLLQFYVQHYWHMRHWEDIMMKEPMSSFSLQSSVIQSRLNQVTPTALHPRLIVGDFNVEENSLFDFWFKKDFKEKSGQMITSALDTTVKTIKLLITEGYFPKSSEAKLVQYFKGPSAKKEATELVKGVRSHSNIKRAIMSSLLHNKLQVIMNGIERADAVQGWLMRLCGEIIEREQLARLAAVCGMLLRQYPVLPGVEADPSIEIAPLVQILKDVRKQFGARDREWLWKQLPLNWQAPVVQDEQAPSLENKLKETSGITLREAVIDSAAELETRLGRLIAAVANENFQMWESGYESFPEWRTLQYILPSHLSALVAVAQIPDTPLNKARLQNLINFLHTLVGSYEKQYFLWLKDASYREEDGPKLDYDENEVSVAKLGANHNHCIYLTHKVLQLMNAFVGLGKDSEGIPGQRVRTKTLVEFQTYFIPATNWDICSALEKFVADAWEKVSHGYFKHMVQISVEAWKPPAPGLTLAHKDLGQLYFANAILEKLIIEMADMLIPTEDMKEPARQIDEMCLVCPCVSENLSSWRSDLLARVIAIAGLLPQGNFTSEDINSFARTGQPVLNKMWGLFYRSIQRIGKFPKHITCLPSDSPMMRKAMDLFVAGCLDELGDFLGLVPPGGQRASLCNKVKKLQKSAIGKQSLTKKSSPKVKSSSTETNENDLEQQYCRACKKKETEVAKFIKCPECVKEKYPDTNFFCSEECKDNWWKEEHMAEHLEYALGLSHLS